MRVSKRQDRLPGIIISLLLLIVDIAFIVLLLYTNLISVKYIGIIFMVQILLTLIVYLLVMKFRKRVRFWIGVGVMILLTAVMGVASFYIYKTVHALDSITGVNKNVTVVGVYVKQDDEAQSLLEAASYSFGILGELDRTTTDQALQQMYYETGTEISTVEYDSLTALADGLNNGGCQAIVLNSAYLDVFDDMDGYTAFSSEIREIATEEVETLVEKSNPVTTTDTEESSDAEETSDSETEETASEGVYTIYISGIDTRGAMTASSRSDINIILTINTQNRQVLMVSTPRDYYVPLSISNGVPDKLTHAGIYGVNVSMDTLEMLYDININYYFRVNFAGFVEIIDTLGGVTVNSDYEFDSNGYHFIQGDNFLNGEQALAFCRERYSFSSGDRQRGKDQMKVIQAVIDKLTSPDLLKNYLSLLEELSGAFETNVPYDVISGLVKDQLDKGGSWTVLSYSVDGTGDTQKPYSMSQNAYVMQPDYTTVDKAKTLMQKVREGTVLTDADVQ